MTALLGIAFTLLRYLWPVLLLGGAYLWADEGWHNAVAKRAETKLVSAQGKITGLQGKLDELDRQRIAQDERWAQVTAAEELRARSVGAQRVQRFNGIRSRILADRSLTTQLLPIPAGVLDDAYAAADPAGASSQPQSPPAADPSAAAVATWATDMYEWTAVCKDRVTEWERFYNGLENAK